MAAEDHRGKTVWIYEEGDVLKIFDTADEARAWFEVNDPEGVAFEYERGPTLPAGSADQHDVPTATDETDIRQKAF
jgi:hypothetical protein